MSLPDKIIQSIKALPESKQTEVLDFIEYLRTKAEQQQNAKWTDLSLSAAMRGMETEQSPYTMEDLEESFS